MKKNIPNTPDKNKSVNHIPTTSAPPRQNPTEAQVRMMGLFLWMLETARDPQGKDKFLELEKTAGEQGYNAREGHKKAIDFYNI